MELGPITDYEGEVKIRMNSDEYGDVLLIPQVVAKADYPKFFAPLITHQRPLESIADAFALVESRADGVGKLVVRLG